MYTQVLKRPKRRLETGRVQRDCKKPKTLEGQMSVTLYTMHLKLETVTEFFKKHNSWHPAIQKLLPETTFIKVLNWFVCFFFFLHGEKTEIMIKDKQESKKARSVHKFIEKFWKPTSWCIAFHSSQPWHQIQRNPYPLTTRLKQET